MSVVAPSSRKPTKMSEIHTRALDNLHMYEWHMGIMMYSNNIIITSKYASLIIEKSDTESCVVLYCVCVWVPVVNGEISWQITKCYNVNTILWMYYTYHPGWHHRQLQRHKNHHFSMRLQGQHNLYRELQPLDWSHCPQSQKMHFEPVRKNIIYYCTHAIRATGLGCIFKFHSQGS